MTKKLVCGSGEKVYCATANSLLDDTTPVVLVYANKKLKPESFINVFTISRYETIKSIYEFIEKTQLNDLYEK